MENEEQQSLTDRMNALAEEMARLKPNDRRRAEIVRRYIPRKCPRCLDYFGVVVSQWPTEKREHQVNGFCATCGYQLKGWRIILGRKHSNRLLYSNLPNVFS